MTPLRFTPPTDHPAGTAFRLLAASWRPLWDADLEGKIRAFDDEVTGCPDTVGACTFITCLGAEPIGLGSYDPRPGPERGLVGWNCVLPEHRGHGHGRAQLEEILRRLRGYGIRRAAVITCTHGFYAPARRMYEACGFTRVETMTPDRLRYELDLQPPDG